MVRNCCIPGCRSECYAGCNVSFHRFPKKNEEIKQKWLQLIPKKIGKNAVVCSDHFRSDDFNRLCSRKTLLSTAVPSIFPFIMIGWGVALWGQLYLPGQMAPRWSVSSICIIQQEVPHTSASAPIIERARRLGSQIGSTQTTDIGMEQIKEEPEVTEVAACRACLATDGRLYDIRQCGLQDTFVKVSGTPFPLDGLHHLCLFCFSELSKFAAFRDRCQRVHELLETLKEWGPLKMEDIRAIDRDSHKFTRNLTKTETENVNSKDPESSLSTPVKTEIEIDSVFVDTNFIKLNKESEDFDEFISVEVEQIKDGDIIEKQEKKPTPLKKRKSLYSSEVSTKATKIDTGNTEGKEKQEKKRTTLKMQKSLDSSEVSTKATKIYTGNTEGKEKQEKKRTTLKMQKSLDSSEVSTKATKIYTGNTEGKEKQEKKRTTLKMQKSLDSSEVSTKATKIGRRLLKTFQPTQP